MGEGNVGGNGSVKWSFRHHNSGGVKQPIKARNGGPPAQHEVSDEGGDAQGYDPLAHADIGARHGRPGYFKVTLAGQSQPIYVQAVDRTNGKNANVPMEIKIEW
jgi:hypothetical protein